jgi:hypothetical protein
MKEISQFMMAGLTARVMAVSMAGKAVYTRFHGETAEEGGDSLLELPERANREAIANFIASRQRGEAERISKNRRHENCRREYGQRERTQLNGVGNPEPRDSRAKQHASKNQTDHAEDDPDIRLRKIQSTRGW